MTWNKHRTLATGILAFLATWTAYEKDASACGGCFAPTENPTIVTDHRMILSVSKEKSTLYDQIKYTGNPASFAWVLPISGTVDVGLSADIVFQVLDGMTQTQLVAPPLNCPAPPSSCDGARFGSAAPSAAEAASGGGVTVTKREVVGPYETVQLKATDAGALQTWLAENHFNVPDDVKPVVDKYLAEKFDFLALKLIPGKSAEDMRPVRVTSTGANVVLPLRMVAAGTGPVVGVSLWVVGEGRYEPQNFPTFHVPTADLEWDWTTNKSNYTSLRANAATAGKGRAWELESSTLLYPQQLQQGVEYGYYSNRNTGPVSTDPEQQAQDAYLPVKDGQGNITKSAVQVRKEDLATLFYGIPASTTRVTRLRADLAHAALDADLVVTASTDQSEFSNVRQITKELNEPTCPVYSGCDTTGSAPRTEAAAQTNSNNGSNTGKFDCSASPPRSSSPAWLGIGGAFLALALAKAARRRKA
jgi:hypothetical protein